MRTKYLTTFSCDLTLLRPTDQNFEMTHIRIMKGVRVLMNKKSAINNKDILILFSLK